VFNVADMGITVGFALILLLMLWDRGPEDATRPPAAED
jgi:lipoprotein signal peptidase